jgi:hypothetical protein
MRCAGAPPLRRGSHRPSQDPDPAHMGRGDRMIFHAVIHVRLFADGEILGNPKFHEG